MASEYFICPDPDDPEQIRFTQKGIECYGKAFGQLGLDIRKIRTRREVREALALLSYRGLRTLAQQVLDPELDEQMSDSEAYQEGVSLRPSRKPTLTLID